jgi:hypothetical protein
MVRYLIDKILQNLAYSLVIVAAVAVSSRNSPAPPPASRVPVLSTRSAGYSGSALLRALPSIWADPHFPRLR